jgi:Holliday junction DNA helicase RuvB
MGAPIRETSGPMLSALPTLIGIVTCLARGAVLFLDEIHAIPRAIAEVLYEVMQEGTLSIPINCGIRGRTLKIRLAPFTVVGATTDPEALPGPLRSRFVLHEEVARYSESDLAAIAMRGAERDAIVLDEDAAQVIARASLGSARRALALEKQVRNEVVARLRQRATAEDARETLRARGIDEDGLGPTHRRILETAQSHGHGRPIGQDRLADLAGVGRRTFRDLLAPELIRAQRLRCTPRGLVACAPS